jgi:hypothetical protein
MGYVKLAGLGHDILKLLIEGHERPGTGGTAHSLVHCSHGAEQRRSRRNCL